MNWLINALSIIYRLSVFLLIVAGIAGLVISYLKTGDPAVPLLLLVGVLLYASPFVAIVFLIIFIFKQMKKVLEK